MVEKSNPIASKAGQPIKKGGTQKPPASSKSKKKGKGKNPREGKEATARPEEKETSVKKEEGV